MLCGARSVTTLATTDASGSEAQPLNQSAEPESAVRDANGNILQHGDTVIVGKDLPVKGASSALKAGTKVRVFDWSRAITTSTAESRALAG